MFSQVIGKYGKRVIVPAILAIGGILYFLLQPHEPIGQPVAQIQPIEIIEQSTIQRNEPLQVEQLASNIVVDVKGAVRYPGVYELTSEHRVVDAIERAGGLTEDANIQLLNNAQRLQDEMVIYVPRVGEDIPEFLSFSTTSTTQSNNPTKMNINIADENELTTLPGIGPAKAQAIIAYRQEKGIFQSIEELKNISGIGSKTFEKFQHLIDIK